jgi:hypothetical protein
MSSRLSKAASATEGFTRWWNAHYFYENRLYWLYKQLYDLGADLDNVDHIVRCLLKHPPEVKALTGEDRSGRLAKPKAEFKKKPQTIEIDPDYLKAMLAATAQLGMKAGTRSDLLSEHKDRDQVCCAIADMVFGKMAAPPAATKKAESVGRINELVQETRSLLTEEDLPAVLRFVLTAGSGRRGRRTDLWGKLFLVALTEYLRSTMGKPHYLIADTILRAERGRASKGSKRDRESAKVQVINFKKQFPEWRALLNALAEPQNGNK